ncbi:MAG: thioredoxin [Nakamurella sp.]
MATVELTNDNFTDTVKKGGTVLVDFWASWCPPCRMFAPVYEASSETHEDLVFGSVNTEEQQELAGGFGISSIPTLMVFRDNILVFQQAGAMPEKSLEDLIGKVRALDMEHVRAEVAKQAAKA